MSDLFKVILTPGQSVNVSCEAGTVVPPPEPAPVPTPIPVPVPVPTPPPVSDTVLFFEDFENDLAKWTTTAKQAQLATFNGRKVLEVNQPAFGWGGEMRKDLPPGDTLYLSMDWYLSPTLETRDFTGRHFWRLGGENGTQVDNETDGGVGELRLQTISFWGIEASKWDAARLPLGKWFRFGFWYKLNDVGASNGERSIYVDGVRVFHEANMRFRAVANRINVLRLVTNFDAAPAGSFWYYDRVQVERNLPAVP